MAGMELPYIPRWPHSLAPQGQGGGSSLLM